MSTLFHDLQDYVVHVGWQECGKANSSIKEHADIYIVELNISTGAGPGSHVERPSESGGINLQPQLPPVRAMVPYNDGSVNQLVTVDHPGIRYLMCGMTNNISMVYNSNRLRNIQPPSIHLDGSEELKGEKLSKICWRSW